MKSCLFCQIVDGKEPAVKILETDGFLVIKNKYPVAPVHLLVLDKRHREKKETLFGKHPGFWDEIFAVVAEVVRQQGLQETGYKIVNNGAGYNHFEHEHLHILGGTSEEPGGST